jgi:DNA-directed RNA polymerase subunit K/omega
MPSNAAKNDIPLSQLMLERSHDKYRLVHLAMRWAQEIKVRDQSSDPTQEIVSRALKEILTGQVSLEDIEKLPPPVKVEPKPLEITKPIEGDLEDDEKPEKPAKEKKGK